MAQSLDIFHLINQPHDRRSEDWDRAFFEAFVDVKLQINDPSPQQGPDGWPYLMASIGPEAKEPSTKIIEWLSNRGIGLAINPQKGVPDYVFTYGMLWNFRERGQFITDAPRVPLGTVELEKGQEVLAGPPSQEFLPDYVRHILRHFFADQGLEEMKILVLSADQNHYDLCFSLDSLGHPAETEHRGIGEAIAWFLPSHYSVVLAPEKGLPDFHRL